MEARPNSSVARDQAYTLHPYANARVIEQAGALVVARGNGAHVVDEDGRAYIESVAGLWCAGLGFTANEKIIAAATDAMRTLPYYHQFGPKAHPNAIDLAERLIGLAPAPMSKVFFACSGSEANDTALKLVRYYNNVRGRPEKKKIISRLRGYHGVTLASASLTGLPYNHALFDLPINGVLHTHCPHHYRGAEAGESEAEFVTRITNDLEAMIREEGSETIAAFIAEPVQGAGGVVVPPAGYFERVQEILAEHDILLIVDEVITGFGRTGNLWGSQTFNIRPDILTCAKMLTSAYAPLSAVMVRDEIYEAIAEGSETIGTFGHGFTYGGHPVACAVGLAVLQHYEDADIMGHVGRLAPYFQERVASLGAHPMVGEVRGVGLVAGVEVVADKQTGRAFDKSEAVAPKVVARAQEHGLISRAIMDTIAVSPPLIVDEATVDGIVSRLHASLDDVARDRGIM
ncbi:MAG: aminotransferase [Pseudomonadota bacterium]